MKNEQILKKAIERAKKNRWEFADLYKSTLDTEYTEAQNISDWYFIFSHDFARAFWGEEMMCSDCERCHSRKGDCDTGTGNNMEEWKIRLRQMVVAEDRLKYIEKFL